MKVALKSHHDVLELIKTVDSVECVKYFSQVFSTAAALSMCMFRLSCVSAIIIISIIFVIIIIIIVIITIVIIIIFFNPLSKKRG